LADARTLHNAIPGAKETTTGEFHIPCFTTITNITFLLKGVGYTIRGDDYVGAFVGSSTFSICKSLIVGYPAPGLHGEWLMGTPFVTTVSIHYTECV
jgi:hypothetical protein